MKQLPKIILVFAAVDWPIYMRRPMVYALADAAGEYDSTVVAVNRPLCLQTTWWRHPSRTRKMLQPPQLEQLARNLHLYTPKYYVHDQIANVVPVFEHINLFALRRSFGHLQRQLGIDESAPVVWFHYPHQGYVTRLFDDSFNILEIYDNLTDTEGTELDYVNRLEEKHRGRIDLLLTTSQQIHHKYAGNYRRSYMFGNGLGRSAYERLTNPETTSHPEITKIPSPRLGYAGMISDRMDWDLIGRLAAREPSWNFVFVGPVAEKKITGRAAGISNIYFLPPRPYEEVPSVLKSFDLGILPYRDNPFFRFLNPLKFYEMAGAGLPMVSSPIEELRQFPDNLVRVVSENSTEKWGETIHSILDSDRLVPRKIGPRVAADYIWEDMTAALLKKLVHN